MRPAFESTQGSRPCLFGSTPFAAGKSEWDVACLQHYITVRNVVNYKLSDDRAAALPKNPYMGEKLDTLARRLVWARAQTTLTQPGLAKACGWDSQSRISHYERGKRIPEPDALTKIAKALRLHGVNVTAAWLQYGEGEGGQTATGSLPVSNSKPAQSLTNQGTPPTESSGTFIGQTVTDQKELQLLDRFRRISATNRRKLLLDAERFCMDDDPEPLDDSFESIGQTNLYRKAKKKNATRDKPIGVPKARHGKNT